jgi:ribose 5-phosphate isomerase B
MQEQSNLYIISDHAGWQLVKDLVKNRPNLQNLNKEEYDTDDDYPDKAKILAEKLKENPLSLGVAICGSGQGMCIALNRNPWIRAGLGYNVKSVALLKQHNHANVICLPAREISLQEAEMLITTFFVAQNSHDSRHLRRIGKL